MKRAVVVFVLAALAGCGGGSAPDPRHPARPEGCAIKPFAAAPDVPVDELGVVTVDCGGTSSTTQCSRRLMDAVCQRGGNIVWGLDENPVTSLKMTAHAAHTSTINMGPRPSGCDVKVFRDAPAVPTENIGPVRAICALEMSDDDCLRTLKDQACKLGGDIIWGVREPEVRDARKHLSGRAAKAR